MNKVLVKNDQRYIVETCGNKPKFLVRENLNKDLTQAPNWYYYFSENPAKAVKCGDTFVAEIMLDDYKKQVKKEIRDKYTDVDLKVEFKTVFHIAPMVISYQIGADE